MHENKMNIHEWTSDISVVQQDYFFFKWSWNGHRQKSILLILFCTTTDSFYSPPPPTFHPQCCVHTVRHFLRCHECWQTISARTQMDVILFLVPPDALRHLWRSDGAGRQTFGSRQLGSKPWRTLGASHHAVHHHHHHQWEWRQRGPHHQTLKPPELWPPRF